jgi:hypothetical protein
MWGSTFADLAKKAQELQEQAKEQASHIHITVRFFLRVQVSFLLFCLSPFSLTSPSHNTHRAPAFSVSISYRMSHPLSQMELSLRRHNPRFILPITQKHLSRSKRSQCRQRKQTELSLGHHNPHLILPII